MSPRIDPTSDEAKSVEFMAAYLDCNETGRMHISTAMELLSQGKSHEEVDRYLESIRAVAPTAEVIDIFTRRPR